MQIQVLMILQMSQTAQRPEQMQTEAETQTTASRQTAVMQTDTSASQTADSTGIQSS